MPAAYTLFFVLIIQTAAMTAWLAWREPDQLGGTMRAWKISSLVGIAGSLASMGWFTAMTMENAAYVRALGQIELVFTFASSHFLRSEEHTSELQSLMRISYAVFCLKKKTYTMRKQRSNTHHITIFIVHTLLSASTL